VTSRYVAEADGTSGQDANSGAGIKTPHIQNGAVTDAKIGGTISASKLPVGTAAGTVAAGDHAHGAQYQRRYAKVAVVSPQYTENTAGYYSQPAAAVRDLPTWCRPVNDATTPCLVKVLPGTYDIGDDFVLMQSNIDVEGSGANTTTVVGHNPAYGVVRFYTVPSELRSIAVVHPGAVAYAQGILSGGGAKITDVTVRVTGGTIANYGVAGGGLLDRVTVEVTGTTPAAGPGIDSAALTVPGAQTAVVTRSAFTVRGAASSRAFGVIATNGTVKMRDSTISATNPAAGGDAFGVWLNTSNGYGSSGYLTNVEIAVDGDEVYGHETGIDCYSTTTSTLRVEGSQIQAATPLIACPVSGKTFLANTRLDGGPSYAAGALKCIGVYDATFDPTCPQ
jgi:hypothetical protein